MAPDLRYPRWPGIVQVQHGIVKPIYTRVRPGCGLMPPLADSGENKGLRGGKYCRADGAKKEVLAAESKICINVKKTTGSGEGKG